MGSEVRIQPNEGRFYAFLVTAKYPTHHHNYTLSSNLGVHSWIGSRADGLLKADNPGK
jgi:hypothetical protein